MEDTNKNQQNTEKEPSTKATHGNTRDADLSDDFTLDDDDVEERD